MIGARELELGSENAIAAISGTKFALEVRPDGTTVLTVLDGSVTFYNALGKVVVGGSEQSTVSPGSPPSRPMRVHPSGYIEWEPSVESLSLGWEMRLSHGEYLGRNVKRKRQAAVAKNCRVSLLLCTE